MSVKRCIIITACITGKISDIAAIGEDDFVICADGGFSYAVNENIIPDVIIGDFDSISYKETLESLDEKMDPVKIIKTEPEKDETDTFMCARYGIEKGFDEFVIIGGLSGRLDHTIANLNTLSYLVDNGKNATILDSENEAMIIEGPDRVALYPNNKQYFSIFAYSEKCTGVNEINSKYLLENATIDQSYPIGTSNELLDEPAIIEVGEGRLLIIRSS